MKKLYIVTVFFIVFGLLMAVEDKQSYKDIGKEHWAYSSVENLINKGIFNINSEFFNGDQKMSRSEFAVYLSTAINKMDDEKASKDDLLIVENLIYEFSKDLNSYGFNVDKYVEKIKEIEIKLQANKALNDQNNIKLETMYKRLEELENFAKEKKISDNKKELLKSIELKIKDSIVYGENVKSIGNKKEYRNMYEAEFKFKGSDYEVGFRKNDKFGALNDIEFMAKGDKKFGKMGFGFHTKGYEKRYNSFYDNLEYSNYKYEKKLQDTTVAPYNESFDSIGIYAENEFFNLSVENVSSEINLINKIDSKYLKTLAIYNPETGKVNYEAALRMVLFKDKFQFGGGYGKSNRIITQGYQTESGDIEMQFINGDIKLVLKGNEYSVGYERKDGTRKMYDLGYGKIRYDITDRTRITYKGEAIKLKSDNYLNHYIIMKSSVYGFDVYLSYKEIVFNKEEMNFKGSPDNINLKDYQKNMSYRESAAKATYKLENSVEVNIGYRMIDGNKMKNNIMFGGASYAIDNSIKLYADYMRNISDNIYEYSDMKRDIDGNVYNVDFDEATGIIPAFKSGVIKVGMELKF